MRSPADASVSSLSVSVVASLRKHQGSAAEASSTNATLETPAFFDQVFDLQATQRMGPLNLKNRCRRLCASHRRHSKPHETRRDRLFSDLVQGLSDKRTYRPAQRRRSLHYLLRDLDRHLHSPSISPDFRSQSNFAFISEGWEMAFRFFQAARLSNTAAKRAACERENAARFNLRIKLSYM